MLSSSVNSALFHWIVFSDSSLRGLYKRRFVDKFFKLTTKWKTKKRRCKLISFLDRKLRFPSGTTMHIQELFDLVVLYPSVTFSA
ncbi:unnamed protein product [Arctia plantaginis]|uniref:Uncharacterized protein n=1 Tax=Arctia plantaginis TaxID=874455 RepID=A0A8S1B278_ARCPL|nr:unnamed protein product [Arctia plantaginis]